MNPHPVAFPLYDDADHARAIDLIDALWEAEPGSPEADLLAVMAAQVAQFEGARRALPPADPRQLLAYKLKERGWSQRKLAEVLGWGSGRVSEVLSGKRPLTLRMVRELAQALDLSPGALVHDVREELPDGVARLEVEPATADLVRRAAVARGLSVDALVREGVCRQIPANTPAFAHNQSRPGGGILVATGKSA